MRNHDRKTSFFIVGAPKSGTTALSYYLSQHSRIHMLPKEIHHFGSDLEFRRPRPTRSKYESLCQNAPKDCIIGDASVFYLYSKRAAYEIYEWSRDAKIIILLRNPVDMLCSLHQQALATMDENIRDFSEALAAEEDRKKGNRIPFSVHPVHALYYREIANYPEQIRRYWSVFGKKNVKIVLFDELISNTPVVFSNITEFLDLEPEYYINFKVVNSATDVRFRPIKFVQKNIFRQQSLLQNYAPKYLYSLLFMIINSLTEIPAKKKPINSNLRNSLRQYFEPSISELSDMIGKDVKSWL